ncbi:hypothetical protein ABW19_dt0207963 [Dactylella cylindrospora]|nr:hypothetical protein ABW19_dt0207963 [Dactylella cylindrospora]
MAQNANLAVHVTAMPQFTPVYGGHLNGFNKRQDFTFSSCGLDCAEEDFCQGYRSNYGFCCPTSVLTRTQFNYCGPAVTCIEYGVSSVSDYFFDSTRSIQYCGFDRPNCATYIYTNDDYTQVFCGSDQSGQYFFDTTSTGGLSATFIGRTSTTSEDEESTTTTPRSTSNPTISNVPNTSGPNSETTTGPINTSSPTSTGEASGGLSTGAVAGIAVGAAIGGIGLAIGAFFLWRRRGKTTPPTTTANNQFPPQPPMDQNGQYYPQNNNNNNTGYYQQHQPYAQVPQSAATELGGNQEFYKANYPPQSPNPTSPHSPQVFELAGGGGYPYSPQPQGQPQMAQLPDASKGSPQGTPYQENQAAPHGPGRQEMQG